MNNVKFLLLGLGMAIIVCTMAVYPSSLIASSVTLPTFIENSGQIRDQHGEWNRQVRYLLPLGNGLNVQLRETGFSYDTYQFDPQTACTEMHRIDIEFMYANPEIEIVSEQPVGERLHFPGKGVYDVRRFGKLTYRNVYPNIDIEFLAGSHPDKPVEYNFILHPGACLADIQLAYRGMQTIQLVDGQLELALQPGTLKEQIPISYWYDNRAEVTVDYTILQKSSNRATVGFSAPVADIVETLVIDPIPHLDWGTYLGGEGDDSSRDMALDAAGNAYIVGSSGSMSAIATAGAHQNTIAGATDAFVAKFDNDGQLLWSTYFGGEAEEYGQSIEVDGQGNVYFSGSTASMTNVATTGAAQETFGGGEYDGFIAKLDGNGLLLWASYFGGTEFEFSNSLAVDPAGNVFTTGWTNSPTGVSTAGAMQPIFGGEQDAFLAKYDTDGNLQWSTYYGDAGFDIGLQLAVNPSGDVIMSGWTSSEINMTTPGAHQETFGGGTADAFLASFATTGNRQWGTYYGASGNDYGDALRLDGAGNIFLGGPTSSTDSIATPGTHQSVPGGSVDAFLVKLDPTAAVQWGTYYGGAEDDAAYGIAFGTDGSIYLGGYTGSVAGIATPEAQQTAFGGGTWDGYWVKFDANGIRDVATYYGGADNDQAFGIDVDANDQVFLTGTTGSVQDIATPGAHQEVFGGAANDAFLARFGPCNEPVLDVPNGGYLCANDPFVLELHFSEAGPYTFVYTIDGVEQPPVTTPDSVYMFSLTSAEYQDSVVITGISSGSCVGTEITGMPFIRVAEPLSASTPVTSCDDPSQTYTVSVQLSGGVFDYVAVAPATGTFNGATFTSSPIPLTDDYNFQLTSGLGCDTLSFTGTPDCNPACPPLDIAVAGNGPICEGEDILLTADDGAVNYTWSGPANYSSTEQNPVISNVSANFSGTYQLIADDGNSCADTFIVEVVVNARPAINNIDAPPLTCDNNMTTVTVDASGAGTLEYSLDGTDYSTQNTFADLTAGNYNIYVRDANGCINQNLLTLQTADGPVVTALEILPPDCGATNGAIVITATGQELPLEYSINDGGTYQESNTFENLSAGEYPIIVRDQSGCTINASATLSGGGDPPVIDEVLIEQAACEANQNSITINVISNSNQLRYSINGIDFQVSNRFENLSSGNYSVTVRDGDNGCSVTEIVNISSLNVLSIESVTTFQADCRGNSGRLEVETLGGSGILTYQLDTLVQTNPEFEGLAPGNYLLTVTDDSGCSQTQQVNITRGDCPIYIANAFSPNEDGINDRFAVFAATGIDGTVVSYQIFNRWGNQVFSAGGFPLGDSGQWWDGNVQGRPAAAGVYIFHLVIELNGGEQIIEQGEVNLLR